MSTRTLISIVATFLMSLCLGFVVHDLLPGQYYGSLRALFPEADPAAYVPWLVLAHAGIAVGFVRVYLGAREDGSFLGQGVRFGLAIAFLMTLPTCLIHYALQPVPAMLVVKQIAYDTTGVVLMGVTVAWINR